MEGVEPTQPYGYQILSLARLPIPPHRPPIDGHNIRSGSARRKLCGGLDEPGWINGLEDWLERY